MYVRIERSTGDVDSAGQAVVLLVEVENEETEEVYEIKIDSDNDPKEVEIVVDGEVVWSAVGFS